MSDLSEQLVESLNTAYGAHAGHRAAHAKGVLCQGSFTATPEAHQLSTAPHFAGSPIRAHVRFSNGSGAPSAADNVRDGRGMAVKLYLPSGGTTDIVSLSLPSFFARTPEDLLAFNAARRPDPVSGQPDVAAVGRYLAAHPEAVAAVTAAITHPIPASYTSIGYHALHSFGFVDAEETLRWGRYHWLPASDDPDLTDEDAATRDPDYLKTELQERLTVAPARFHLEIQLAGEDDPIDDPTVEWAGDRERVRAGSLDITALAFDREQGDDILVFDPTRVPDGIRLSDDAILLARPGAYAVSVARRTAKPN